MDDCDKSKTYYNFFIKEPDIFFTKKEFFDESIDFGFEIDGKIYTASWEDIKNIIKLKDNRK